MLIWGKLKKREALATHFYTSLGLTAKVYSYKSNCPLQLVCCSNLLRHLKMHWLKLATAFSIYQLVFSATRNTYLAVLGYQKSFIESKFPAPGRCPYILKSTNCLPFQQITFGNKSFT